MRATPAMVPLTVAQTTASPMLTSGSAGFAGGFLPVVARQEESRSFLATAAAPRAATRENTEYNLLLSVEEEAMSSPYPAVRRVRPASRAETSTSGRRELTSQYGVGSAGSAMSTRTPRLR